MEEPCYLVKDVGDIVLSGQCRSELLIVAIDDDLAWVRNTHLPDTTGWIEKLEDLTFVRSTVAEDFEPALDHAVDPFAAIPCHS